MKIVQISDIHLEKNPKRHNEYKEVFDKLLYKIKEIKPDIIVTTGDDNDNYNNIEGEQLIIATKLNKELAEIAPLRKIRGNHDYNQKSIDRTDSIEAIIESIKSIDENLNIIYYNKTGIYQDRDFKNIVWAVWHHGDNKSPWTEFESKEKNKFYIDLYHNPIRGCKSETGRLFDDVKYPSIADLKGDISMMGDIHLYQTFDNGKKAYASSLIQRNFGEKKNNHGILVWDTETLTHEFIEIENNYSFETIEINNINQLEEIDLSNISKNPKFRIIWKDKQSEYTKINEKIIEAFFKKKFNVLPKIQKEKQEILEGIDESIELINKLHDEKFLFKIIKEILTEQKYDQSFINKVINLDLEITSKINNLVSYGLKNIKIHKLELENFMCYGENNKIEFDNLDGISFIVAPNQSGKTTLFSALTYLLFESTLYTKTKKRVFNNKVANGTLRLSGEFSINNERYLIERTISKKINSKGVADFSASTLEVKNLTTKSLENESKNLDTEKFIETNFGSFQDFIRNNFVTGDIMNNYISATPAILIDSLQKDMGFHIYDIKEQEFKLYRENIEKKEGKIVLDINKENEKVELIDKEVLEHNNNKEQLTNNNVSLTERLEKGLDYRKQVENQLEKIDEEIKKYNPTLLEEKNIEINNSIISMKNNIELIKNKIQIFESTYQNKNFDEVLEKKKNILDNISLIDESISQKLKEKNNIQNSFFETERNTNTSIQTNLKEISNHELKISNLDSEVKQSRIEYKDLKQRRENLNTEGQCVSCGNTILKITEEEKERQFKILEDAEKLIVEKGKNLSESIKKMTEKIELIKNSNLELEEKMNSNKKTHNENILSIDESIKLLEDKKNKEKQNLKSIEEKLSEYDKFIAEEKEIIKTKNKLETIPLEIEIKNNEITSNNEKIKLYKKEESKIEKNKNIQIELNKIDDKLNVLKNELETNKSSINSINTKITILEENKNNIIEKINKYKIQQEQEQVFDVYKKLVSRNGLPMILLKKTLPLINMELDNLFSEMNFKVYFNQDVELMMESPASIEPQPVLQGSGMERTFAALALKFASLKLNNNIKYDIVLLDECTDKLDENSLDLFKTFLLKIQEIVSKIFIISHTNNLADLPNHIIKPVKDEETEITNLEIIY